MPNSDRALLLGKALVPSWGSISLTEMGSAASFATPEPATPYPSTGPIPRGRAEATRSMRIAPARYTLRMVQKLTTSSSLTEARDSWCSPPGQLERARLSRERRQGWRRGISGVLRLARNRHYAQNPPIGTVSDKWSRANTVPKVEFDCEPVVRGGLAAKSTQSTNRAALMTFQLLSRSKH